MIGASRGRIRSAVVAAGVLVAGVLGAAALAAAGGGATVTPVPTPSPERGVLSQPDDREGDEPRDEDREGGGPPVTPPGQQKAREARGNGQVPRSDGPVSCESARNHGEYVSWVARTTPPGPDKGATVAAAAESDCPPGFRDGPEE